MDSEAQVVGIDGEFVGDSAAKASVASIDHIRKPQYKSESGV